MDSHDAGASLWFGTFLPPTFPSYAGKARTNVCVVGGGITGLSTAYLLMKAGKKVTVLDAGSLGEGETGHSTAHLTCAMDARLHQLERRHGADAAREIVRSHRAAIDQIEAIVGAEKIDCDFRRVAGYLVLDDGSDPRLLDEELAAAHRAGLEDTVRLASLPEATLGAGPALCFPNQAQFHALKYAAGLASAIVLGGGRLYSDTRVTSIESGTPCKVRTEGNHTLTADAVCVCTGTPIGDAPRTHPETAARRTFVIAAMVPRGSVPEALYRDTCDPCHYARVQPIADPAPRRRRAAKLDALIVGGEDDDDAGAPPVDAERRWDRLEQWMRERWPQAKEVAYRWSGRVYAPGNDVGLIGRSPDGAENVYVAAGCAGQGMTHAMLAGTLLSDLVCGRANALDPLVDPGRA